MNTVLWYLIRIECTEVPRIIFWYLEWYVGITFYLYFCLR